MHLEGLYFGAKLNYRCVDMYECLYIGHKVDEAGYERALIVKKGEDKVREVDYCQLGWSSVDKDNPQKVELEVDDITLLVKSLNNAIAAYGDIACGIFLGCEVPSKFKMLKELPWEDIQSRVECLKDVYRQVEELEKRCN